jgi:hypothetical protein
LGNSNANSRNLKATESQIPIGCSLSRIQAILKREKS